jgi:hypothetical protein
MAMMAATSPSGQWEGMLRSQWESPASRGEGFEFRT